MLLIGAAPLTVDDIRAVARDGMRCRLSGPAAARIEAAHAATLALLGAGAPIYGVTTGLGAAADTALPAADPDRQRRIPLARAAGVGPILPRDIVRAMMLARLSRLAYGASGMSLAMAEALAAMLDRGITPAVPAIGSIGEADLVPLAHIAAILSGVGTAEIGGVHHDAPDALAIAGITVPLFGPKDGLALLSSNAGSVGPAALLAADAARALDAALSAAALSLEGFRGSLSPFEPRATTLRPTPGQVQTAAALRALLAGGDLPTAARRLQDPLSFRVIASVHAAAAAALKHATTLIELELNSSDDNPAILIDPAQALPTANFDATALALAVETVGQALLRAAAAAARVLRLMSPATNDLPRFLAAPGQNGFATVQKTLAALLATMQHDAAPMPVCVLPVADSVEDYASMALPIVDKTARVLTNFRYVVAIELMVAAQACDLRRPLRLGVGTTDLHARIRREIPTLTEDRPTGPDIERLAALIANGTLAP